jgi:hypothetical protein
MPTRWKNFDCASAINKKKKKSPYTGSFGWRVSQSLFIFFIT